MELYVCMEEISGRATYKIKCESHHLIIVNRPPIHNYYWFPTQRYDNMQHGFDVDCIVVYHTSLFHVLICTFLIVKGICLFFSFNYFFHLWISRYFASEIYKVTDSFNILVFLFLVLVLVFLGQPWSYIWMYNVVYYIVMRS